MAATTSTLEAIEAALAIAVSRRPPRAPDTAAEGRYASLAITALEEARNWERNRQEVAVTKRNYNDLSRERESLRRA